VCGLLTTAVKGLRVAARDAIRLDADGVAENRRFFLIDERGRMVNGKRLGSLQALVADYSPAARTLTLRFPDGSEVGGAIGAGTPLQAQFLAHPVPATLLDGPWSEALSAFAGTPLRLVESALSAGAVDRGATATVSLVSRASLERLAAAAGVTGRLDARRLRMLIEIDGVEAHAEDVWLERPLRIGEALIMIRGHVGRCVVTARDPESGERNVDTLGALASYRREADTTEPLGCGVYGEILEPGVVRVGDPVALA